MVPAWFNLIPSKAVREAYTENLGFVLLIERITKAGIGAGDILFSGIEQVNHRKFYIGFFVIKRLVQSEVYPILRVYV